MKAGARFKKAEKAATWFQEEGGKEVKVEKTATIFQEVMSNEVYRFSARQFQGFNRPTAEAISS